jgi:hypothetical protein
LHASRGKLLCRQWSARSDMPTGRQSSSKIWVRLTQPQKPH